MDPPRCARCGEPIGVYEPIRILRPDGTERVGSWLVLHNELKREHRVFHEDCSAEPGAADS